MVFPISRRSSSPLENSSAKRGETSGRRSVHDIVVERDREVEVLPLLQAAIDQHRRFAIAPTATVTVALVSGVSHIGPEPNMPTAVTPITPNRFCMPML